ncbi:hypothetical protein J5J10_01505 [Ciceribacter sp. L1K23]|uniref:hypothetical protein n=1 Tax=Ciceribacter sp. L1K23 TaxID=2820276 RepID=UPI001B823E20|nr:hypothetical protein [Ciceribacter sp. L1K23]MBR0554343.1 hypothetical protein [Ciceribacter sp. L1K23]
MSNRLFIERTRFTSLDSHGNTVDESWGFRAYDDFATTYNNGCASLDELIAQSPEDLIRSLALDPIAGRPFVRFACEANQPIFIDDQPVEVPQDVADMVFED